MVISLIPYDEQFLTLSWEWLHDSEIKAMTLTPDFDREDQRRFFQSLPHRVDYKIWGVSFDRERVGATGLKNIDGTVAEYWGYLGKKALWGRGLGVQMMDLVTKQARQLGIRELVLTVSPDNHRARKLYEKVGFAVTSDDETKMRKMI